MSHAARAAAVAVAAVFAACAQQPAPQPQYAQQPAPPPPPAQPAQPAGTALVRVIHASPDPMAAGVTAYLDNGTTPVANLTYRAAEGYTRLPAGTHTVQARLPNMPPTAPPVLQWTTPAFQPEHAYTVIAHGLASELSGPPVTFVPEEDTLQPAPAGSARLRFFHALVGGPAVDVCLGNAAAFANVSYGQWGSGSEGRYAVAPAGNGTLTVRRAGGAPCTGQPVGSVSAAVPPGANVTLVAVGRLAHGRGAVAPEVLVCQDQPLAGPSRCAPTPLR